jgi:hypothetical protein
VEAARKVEGRLIHPFGLNREANRVANRLKCLNLQTAPLFPPRTAHCKQGIPKLACLPRLRLKPHDEIHPHPTTSDS